MEITGLRYFMEVAQRGSIREAAERNNISPSAVSRHIAKLEHVVKATLFERQSRGMSLTDQGRILQCYAQRTVGNLDSVKSAMHSINIARTGTVRVAALEAYASNVLYPAIAEFHKKNASLEVQVEVIERYNCDVVNRLLSDEADIGIMYKLENDPDLDYAGEYDNPFAAIVAPSHPMAKRREVSIRELAGLPVAGLDPATATRRITDQVACSESITFSYLLTVNSIEAIKEFARSGLGVGVLCAIAARQDCAAGELVAVPFSEWALGSAKTAVCTRHGRNIAPPVRLFLDELLLHYRTV